MSYFRTFLGILMLFWCLLLGCSYHDNEEAVIFIQNLERKCKWLSIGQDLRMMDINTGDWDWMYIFEPYSLMEDIEASIKTKLTAAITDSMIHMRDDINLFIFMKDENLQLVVAVPLGVINVSVSKGVQPIPRSSAVFRYQGKGVPATLINNK